MPEQPILDYAQPPASPQPPANLLAMFHYIVGLIELLFSGPALLMSGFGCANLTLPWLFTLPRDPSLAWLRLISGLAVAAAMALSGYLTIRSGAALERRDARRFSQYVAAWNLLIFPLGTILGVWTLLDLMRPSVRQEYQTPQ